MFMYRLNNNTFILSHLFIFYRFYWINVVHSINLSWNHYGLRIKMAECIWIYKYVWIIWIKVENNYLNEYL